MQKASERMEEKVQAVLKNPPMYDKNGRIIGNKTINYRDALEIACAENPELVKEYKIEIQGGLDG